jgi:hypothetical protein
MMDSIEGVRHDAHHSRSPDRSASDHYRSRQADRLRQDVIDANVSGAVVQARPAGKEYESQSALPGEGRRGGSSGGRSVPEGGHARGTPFNGAQMASFGRTVRLARPPASISEAVTSLAREFLQQDSALFPRNEIVAWECSADIGNGRSCLNSGISSDPGRREGLEGFDCCNGYDQKRPKGEFSVAGYGEAG